jgi:hypothetical protein
MLPQDTLTEVGKLLLLQNIVSVEWRYWEPVNNQQVDAFTFVPYTKPVSLIQALKLCECLDYQSCETDDYFDTHAYKKLQQIAQRITSTLITTLPGYDDAEWSI